MPNSLVVHAEEIGMAECDDSGASKAIRALSSDLRAAQEMLLKYYLNSVWIKPGQKLFSANTAIMDVHTLLLAWGLIEEVDSYYCEKERRWVMNKQLMYKTDTTYQEALADIRKISDRSIQLVISRLDELEAENAKQKDLINRRYVKLVKAKRALESIADHRKLCWEYDEDCRYDLRDFVDTEEWDRVESEARRCLDEIGGLE
jgi:hypothetical protein